MCARRYINFGALWLQFLLVAQEYAKLTDPSSVAEHDTSIAVIEVLMTLLTYGLLLSFGVVAIKKGVAKARSVDTKKLGAKIRNLTSKKKKAKPSSGAQQESRTTNAMHSGGAGDLDESSSQPAKRVAVVPSNASIAASFRADSEEEETPRLDNINSLDGERSNPDVRLEMRTLGQQAETSVDDDVSLV